MLTLVDEQIQDLEFEVKPGETLTLRLAAFAAFPSASINVKVHERGVFDGAFADFSQGKGTFKVHVELLGEHSSATWHYAGRSTGDSDKTIDASIDHRSPRCDADVSQYGIAMGQSKLVFVGDSHIYQGMPGCQTAQKEKIIVFDKGAVGKCSPILRIDENDVVASHSAIVGKLSDEHLFYMLSRGVDLDTAKRLLTLGYLKPVLTHFEGELGERILNSIEEGF